MAVTTSLMPISEVDAETHTTVQPQILWIRELEATRELAVDLDGRRPEAKADLERRAHRDVGIAVIDRDADAEAHGHDHGRAVTDEQRREIRQVAVEVAAIAKRVPAEHEVDPGARREAELQIETRRSSHEQA